MEEEVADKKRNDPRTTSELVHLALTEPDEDAAWEPVTVLHHRATREVLEAAEQLCASSVAQERELGANILGQLGIPERAFHDKCFKVLSRMLLTEEDPCALNAITVAFGHLDDPRCIDHVLPLRLHPDSDVRFGVVLALSAYHTRKCADATTALIELSNDADDEVRDWATFGLSALTAPEDEDFAFFDTPEIREALWAEVSDPYPDARAEALVGLAYRKDPRIVEPLLELLNAERVGTMIVEAAMEIGDPRLLPALLKLNEWWPGDSKWDAELLDKAIASCSGKREQQ